MGIYRRIELHLDSSTFTSERLYAALRALAQLGFQPCGGERQATFAPNQGVADLAAAARAVEHSQPPWHIEIWSPPLVVDDPSDFVRDDTDDAP